MKIKIAVAVITFLLALLAPIPVHGGPSAYIGLGIPAAAIYLSGGQLVVDGVFPLPLAETGLFFYLPLGKSRTGGFKVGAGARAICYLIGTSFGGYAWPDMQAEWRLGSFIAELRVGGGIVAGYSDSGFSFQTAPVIFPGLSFWWAPGSRGSLRLGGGAFGKLSLPGAESIMGGLTDGLLLYAGFKAVIGQ